MAVKLEDFLLESGQITTPQLEEALQYQKTHGGGLNRVLVSLGILKDEDVASAIGLMYHLPSVELQDLTPTAEVLGLLTPEIVRKYQVLPLSVSGKTLRVAIADPTNLVAMDDVRFMAGLKVEPVVAGQDALLRSIELLYGPDPRGGSGLRGPDPSFAGPGLTAGDMASVRVLGLSQAQLDSMSDTQADVDAVKADDEIDLGNPAQWASASPVVKLTNVIFMEALSRGASDIHVEPYEKEFRVRFRIDGILYNLMALPMMLRDPLVSRIKTLAKLTIAEKHRPQRGRITLRLTREGRLREVAFGVSVLPTLWGEKIVMRCFDKSKLKLDMNKLGFEPLSLQRFQKAIAKPYGVVLIGGATGSGRSNTAYAALAALNTPALNIMTTEDPVGFYLPGINQVDIRESNGPTPVAAFNEFLVQDPDVVFMDGLNDGETARIGFSIALTGHRVVSTFNANDAPTMVSRLIRLGLEPDTVACGAVLLQAQRLVRRLCSQCKRDATAEMPSPLLVDIGFSPEHIGTFSIYKGTGCVACNGTGYKGRVGLFEVMEISESIRELIRGGSTAAEIKKKALEEGMLTLRMSGLEKIRSGITSVEEVVRETSL
jgi:type IV pilus assembly protein PilB